MSVQELSLLHRRYIDLSDRFKAAWTFHQFLQGIHKVFSEAQVGRDTIDFQTVYASLKSVSQNLNASATTQLRGQLDRVEGELRRKIDRLLEEDNRVSPGLLRQFFQRVGSYNDKILLQLLKFFVYNGGTEDWDHDRVDKVDFLLTKLSEQVLQLERDPIERSETRLGDILHGLWTLLHVGLIEDEEVTRRLGQVTALRTEMGVVKDLDDLNERELVFRFRELKHELGKVYLEPQLAQAIVEANAAYRETIQRLYRIEEQRIHSEFNEVFLLERDADLDPQLEEDLGRFRSEMERFERRLEDSNLRLEDVASLRQQVRSLLPRLRRSAARRTGVRPAVELPAEQTEEAASASTGSTPKPAAKRTPPAPSPGPESRRSPAPTGRFSFRSAFGDLLAEELRRLLEVLEASDREASPRAVAVTPEAQRLRLQAREVVAFRRLRGGESCDEELERFLLECAAVRIRITREAEELVSGVGERDSNGHRELLSEAKRTNRLADSFQYRLEHHVHQALEDGDGVEAKALQFLRMRLLRDYAGLFLLTTGAED